MKTKQYPFKPFPKNIWPIHLDCPSPEGAAILSLSRLGESLSENIFSLLQGLGVLLI